MNTPAIIGHDHVLEKFQRWIAADRLASTYLLAGPQGIGKYRTARFIARSLLCEGTHRRELTFCGRCSACQQFDAGTHPDLLEVTRPAGKNLIPLELLIGPKEQRMRAGLCHDLALKPFRGGYRICIIDEADFLNQEGANCLLKTLEEPPPHALIFLIASNEHRQLPTIRSRCQIVRFRPLQVDEISRILRDQELVEEDVDVNELALAAGGNLDLARQMASGQTLDFRSQLFQQLATLDPTDHDFAEILSGFVDEAGKDAAARRDRLRMVADLATMFFRDVMLLLAGHSAPGDPAAPSAVASAVARWRGDLQTAADCLERCLDVRSAIAANANPSVLVECWLSDLGRIMRGEPVTTG